MKARLIAIALCLVLPVLALGDKDKKKKGPPDLAGKSAKSSKKAEKAEKDKAKASKVTPPALAKKTALPPGLEKKFGTKRPAAAYVAYDPKRTDRAWLLIDGKWKLEEGFDGGVESEVKASLAFPTVTPPVPLPDVGAKLRVVKFD